MPQYQGVWSLQQQMQALTSGQWATDPLFDYTTLLLQGDAGANGAQNNVFYDTSPNQFAITRNGGNPGMTQGTFSPFSSGGWSGYFDGTSDYIQYTNSDFSVSTGDFTAEWWMFITSDKSQVGIMTAATNANLTIGYGSGSANARQPYVEWGGSGAYIGTMSGYMNTWVHICIMRSSGTVYTFQNGVLLGSASKSAAVGSTANMVIGTNAGDAAAQSVPGYLSNVRFAKSAIYSITGFTPSTSALTRTSQNATNVQFLTLQSNRFLDSDGINTPAASPLTITRNGDVSVQAFSPFAPQYQYTASVTGGSGYFDGTGDYLTWTGSAIGTSQFSFECWFYHTGTYASIQTMLGPNSTTNGGISVRVASSTQVKIDRLGVGESVFTVPTMVANTWYHLVACRGASNTTTVFLNGTRSSTGTITDSYSYGNAASISYLNSSTPFPFTGYIANARLVVGSSVYDPTQTSITIPTAPLTAVANTQLLLNFTNAGILDGTMKNNLETVGGASVSTSVVKYGSGSLSFDGSGDSLTAPSVPLFNYGSANFTVELWIYLNAAPSNDAGIIDQRPTSTNGNYFMLGVNSSRQLFIYVNSVYRIGGSASTVLNLNTWTHVSYVRFGATGTLYINGSSVGTWADSTTYLQSPMTIGRHTQGGSDLNAYMDDLRITNGFARYTQNFIPPSVALPRQ